MTPVQKKVLAILKPGIPIYRREVRKAANDAGLTLSQTESAIDWLMKNRAVDAIGVDMIRRRTTQELTDMVQHQINTTGKAQ